MKEMRDDEDTNQELVSKRVFHLKTLGEIELGTTLELLEDHVQTDGRVGPDLAERLLGLRAWITLQ